MLVHGRDQAQRDNRLHQVLNRLAESKITLNKVKCEFSVSKVKVLGHIVSSEGIAADPEKIGAIRNLATPRNVAKVRSFMGMVNRVSKFADHLASKTKPIKGAFEKEKHLGLGSTSGPSIHRNQRSANCCTNFSFV